MSDPAVGGDVGGDDDPAADTADRAVHVDGLGHAFGTVPVLEDVSFTVPRGVVTAVVGPNGSGKTTLLRLVGGLLPPTRGTVRVDPDGVRPVGYLPQSPAFRPSFTARETVAFYADLLGTEAAVDVDAALDRVGLSEVADRRVAALSGGMTRLLGLAVAVLGAPRLVLLDEPTGDLDPLMTEHIFSVVDDLADDGMAVLLATHDLTGAATADRVLVLAGGRVVADGPPRDLLADHDVDSLAALFRAVVGEERTVVGDGRERAGDEPAADERGGTGP